MADQRSNIEVAGVVLLKCTDMGLAIIRRAHERAKKTLETCEPLIKEVSVSPIDETKPYRIVK